MLKMVVWVIGQDGMSVHDVSQDEVGNVIS